MIGGGVMDLTPESWMDSASCATTDPDMFFPEAGGSNVKAHAVCAVCPVAGACRDFAVRTKPEFGIWGGQSARSLRKEAS